MYNKLYINALTKKYEAEIAEAEANLDLYLRTANLAAIGEHSDLVEEHDKWITKIADAKGKLEVLKDYNSTDTTQRVNS